MESSKDLRRPTDWYHFETLCCKLWGEIWNCPNIKKNGRNGQNQNGVDVSAYLKAEKGYFGIQCKGKDAYKHKKITKKEIDIEIEKAKKFNPPLVSFYFATTAVKDAKIEEYVRLKNIENIEEGLFSIEIYSWEDIVDKIDENPRTKSFYLNSSSYQSSEDIGFYVNEKCSDFEDTIEFKKETVTYEEKFNFHYFIDPLASLMKGRKSFRNESLYPLEFCLKNEGLAPLDNIKIVVEFDGNFLDIQDTNIKLGDVVIGINSFDNKRYSLVDNVLQYQLKLKTIVQKDHWFSDTFYFVCNKEELTKISMKWQIFSRNAYRDGTLKVNIEPKVLHRNVTKLAETATEVGTSETFPIEDILETIEDK